MITYPSIIQAYQNIGVKYETWDQAGVPKKMGYDSMRDWSPHVGFAYRVFDGPKSFVLRGGYSKSYFAEGLWTWLDQSAAATPLTANFNRNFNRRRAVAGRDRGLRDALGAHGDRGREQQERDALSTNLAGSSRPVQLQLLLQPEAADPLCAGLESDARERHREQLDDTARVCGEPLGQPDAGRTHSTRTRRLTSGT